MEEIVEEIVIDLNVVIENTSKNFDSALSEFTRQAGYVEGTLDTIIGMSMDTTPEVSLVSDRLVKVFHGLEGICRQGFRVEFDKILNICRQLIAENEKLRLDARKNRDLSHVAELLTTKPIKSKESKNG